MTKFGEDLVAFNVAAKVATVRSTVEPVTFLHYAAIAVATATEGWTMSAGTSFRVRALRDDDGPAVLEVLNSAFSRQLTLHWYDWKHRSGPWGPSVGWVAEDSTGRIVAVRLFLPWELAVGDKVIPIYRAMDGAVAPNAQRQGLFSRCVRAEMDAMIAGRREARLIYSTSVPASREAYRKLGWSIYDVPRYAHLAPPALTKGKALEWDADFDVVSGHRASLMETNWTNTALRWRTASASGREYHWVTMQAGGQHGVIVRRTRLKNIPALAVVHEWGAEVTTRRLVRIACGALRSPLAISSDRRLFRGPARRTGTSTVSMWSPDAWHRAAFDQMRFDLADLEGAM